MIFKLLIFLDKDITEKQLCFSSHVAAQLSAAWTPLPAPCQLHVLTLEREGSSVQKGGTVPEGFLFCACEPWGCKMQGGCWWRKLMKTQAHTALWDLAPKEADLLTNSPCLCLPTLITAGILRLAFPSLFSPSNSAIPSAWSQGGLAPSFWMH